MSKDEKMIIVRVVDAMSFSNGFIKLSFHVVKRTLSIYDRHKKRVLSNKYLFIIWLGF